MPSGNREASSFVPRRAKRCALYAPNQPGLARPRGYGFAAPVAIGLIAKSLPPTLAVARSTLALPAIAGRNFEGAERSRSQRPDRSR